LIEKSGIIWITARGSNTRFNPSISLPNPKAFSVFTSADGFTCCVQSMFQDQSGKVWWGTGQGLYNFDQTRFYQVKRSGLGKIKYCLCWITTKPLVLHSPTGAGFLSSTDHFLGFYPICIAIIISLIQLSIHSLIFLN
jgi:hypothetical protein